MKFMISLMKYNMSTNPRPGKLDNKKYILYKYIIERDAV